ncbi:MAG: choice-of-anchor L domain-containing protein, partial [Saprospiraceae bacterium]|nr:choice-of-anchor L domain-containing protein [Saprospiraceae bacterium]
MKISSYSALLLTAWLLATDAFSLQAQEHLEIQINSAITRTPVVLTKGANTIRLCGLEPANTYKLIAVPMANSQQAHFEVAPAPALSKGASKVAFMREQKNAVTFSAPESCLDIQINAQSLEQDQDVPTYISIVCESCTESRSWINKVSGMADLSLLEVQSDLSAEHLIENVLVGGGCFQISNVTYQGMPTQIGTFTNGSTNIGFNSGIVLATGNIGLAPGPNDTHGSSWGFGVLTPDPDLGPLANANVYDMANIEFDFIPTQNTVTFEFVFASEEYCEYVNSAFNDAFGFFISGPGINGTQNLAVVPSTNTPVSINTINHITNSGLYVHNTPVVHQDCPNVPATTGLIPQEIQYDGFTRKMVAVATVVPCEKYHIKLKIADAGDGVWDSAVFLKANSFDAGGEVLTETAYPGGQNAAFEGCEAGKIRFSRSNSNINIPMVVQFITGGTAVPGVDYVPLNSPVIIPAGQTEIFIPVQVLADGLTEGPENIQLVVPNTCSCSQGVVEFVINDRPVFTANMNAQSLCVGETATLSPAINGGLPGLTY